MSPRTAAIAALLTLVPAGSALAIDISWSAIHNGVTDASGGGFTLRGTLGQAGITRGSGGDLALTGGIEPQTMPAEPPACPGDADGDNDVDLSDLAVVLSEFGRSEAGLGGDVDGDQDVDLSDLAIVLAQFGTACS